MTRVRRRNSRARVLFGLFLCAFGLCTLRLGWLQIVTAPELAQAAEASRVTTVTIPAKRGDIVDSSGTVLATSVPTYDIYAARQYLWNWAHVVYVDADGNEVPREKALVNGQKRAGISTRVRGYGALEAARLLAPKLKKNAAELGGELSGTEGSRIIATNVPVSTWREIREMGIPGIDGVTSYRREYPNGATASTILGFTALAGDGAPGSELEGKAGVEATQNKLLVGKNGQRRVEISPSGQTIPGGYSQEQAAVDGNTVTLTINADLQALSQDAIDQAVDHIMPNGDGHRPRREDRRRVGVGRLGTDVARRGQGRQGENHGVTRRAIHVRARLDRQTRDLRRRSRARGVHSADSGFHAVRDHHARQPDLPRRARSPDVAAHCGGSIGRILQHGHGSTR
ncbi:hypothetical protein H8R18_03025 [Nanchangia anserum]|nr:hypothetical protein [Nanchangia anserum]QOX82314.1 hypothetical protein H8R18_03025 [Nanchangia anserum]